MTFIIAHMDWLEFPLGALGVAACIWAISKIFKSI